MRERVVEPELLDSLPADHPDAVAARRDLRLINGLMGNGRWLERELVAGAGAEAADRVLEVGAGDGSLARRLGRALPSLAGRYAAVDLAERPPGWPGAFDWVQADLFSDRGAEEVRRARVVVAVLVLHHFDDRALARLGELCGGARRLIVVEPARRRLHVGQGRLLAPLARFNRVTRHDLPVSVRAGFRGEELPRALGLDQAGWRWRVQTTLLGAYRLAAVRE